MPSRKGEPVNPHDEDILENVYKTRCGNCGHKNIRIVSLSEAGHRTQNFANACTNPNCFHFWDLEKIPSWVPA